MIFFYKNNDLTKLLPHNTAITDTVDLWCNTLLQTIYTAEETIGKRITIYFVYIIMVRYMMRIITGLMEKKIKQQFCGTPRFM